MGVCIHSSAVKAYSESLPAKQRESLCKLVKVRDEMVHLGIDTKGSDVQQLDAFIAIVKGRMQ